MKEEHAEKTLKQMFLRIGSDTVFRMHSFAVLSLTWNFAYALLHGLLSIRLYSW